MKYMGSKRRIAKHILPIILKDRKDGQWYVEPFVGGANIIDKVDGKRLGADSNHYLISLLKKMQIGWLPPEEISREDFNKIKENKSKYDDWLVGYVGFQLSFGAMWFGSYAKDNEGKRNYAREAFNNVKRQAEKINGIEFLDKSYTELIIPSGSIIYCDPPYKGTAKYKASKEEFNHEHFWQWCRDKSKEGHQVFVSEYAAPDDFICVWKQELNVTVAKKGKQKKAIEKLFVHSGQLSLQVKR